MNAFERHGITHLSASHLNLFVAQPALWAASYLMKRKTPVGPAAHRGTAVEAGVEAGLFNPDMPLAECQKIALDRFEAATRQGLMNTDPRIDKERDCIEGSVETALKELRQYGKPATSEDRQHKIEVTLPGVPVPFIGFLDFLFPDHGIVVDLKTTARIPSEMSDAHCRQGAIYAQAMGNHEIRFAYVSAKKIAVYVLNDAAAHLASVTRTAKAIENFLSLSDDSELLTKCFAPDLSSFYWGDASAKSIAHEIWG